MVELAKIYIITHFLTELNMTMTINYVKIDIFENNNQIYKWYYTNKGNKLSNEKTSVLL